jgi:Flp pilus assembly protein TadD
MTMHRQLELWSLKTLLTASALALLAAGCASSQSAAKSGSGKAPLPDEEEGMAQGGEKPAGGAAASAGPAEIPLAKKKTSDRQVTDEQKAAFDKAVADYQRAKKTGALSPGDCGSLAGAFKKLANQAPAMLEARNNEATIYLECNRKDEAISIWNAMANGSKPYAPALANLGYLSWQSGNKSGAESYFNRSVQADPLTGSIFARINLAQILRERARTVGESEKKPLNDQAVRHLRTVLALDGNSLQAYAGLTYIYYDLGLPEAAKLVGAQAIKRAKEIATGVFEDESTVAEETAKKAKKGKAKKEKEEAKDAGPKAASDTPAGTGYTTEMRKAVAVVYNTLGMIALAKKNYTEAIKNYKNAVESDPALYEARLNLAALSLKFRNYDTAEENLREVLKAQPKNYEAIIGLGVALRGNKKFDEAEVEYNRARTLDPQRPESYFNLGILYQEYKGGSDKPMLQKAQAYYRDYLSRAQSPKMRKDAEKRIKDIDETFAALKEAEQMMKEAEEMQRKAEAQQKQMEEQMKKAEADEKAKAEADKKKAEDDKLKAEEDKKKAEEEKAKAAEDKKKAAEEKAAKPAGDKAGAEDGSSQKAEAKSATDDAPDSAKKPSGGKKKKK